MTNSSHKSAGYTLIEAVVVVFVFSMIVYGVIMLVSNLLGGSNKQGNLLNGSDQARRVGAAFTNELRRSSNGINGAFPIGLAGDQEILFYSNIDSSPDIERVRYYSQNGSLMKGVVKPSGGIYNLAAETVSAVQNDLGNGATPVFYYYSSDYDGTADSHLTQPVNINQVKYVRLNLLIKNRGGLTDANTYTVTAGAAVRNLKTNLGD
ncbi:MAG: type II secretion system protein J [Candidatus Saccharibacteria bacterium]